MLKEERQQLILNEVELHNRVLLTDLSEKLDVSVDTVRRDVKELDAGSKLRKVHGGAISLGYTHTSTRSSNIYALNEKMAIAEKAIGLLREGDVIFIDGGTTCLEMARMIPPKLKLSCFTFSLPVALQLAGMPNVDLIFIGGRISRESMISNGMYTIQRLAEMRFDYAFIGTGYVDALHGLTEFDWDVVQLKKAVINASKKTILLCISEKLNSQHRFKTCDIHAINSMITELSPENKLLNPFRNQDLRLL
ncbi:MAG: DeoR/GlpR transcriptional regulator [Flavobacteriaceae bacterium]|nr:DeoR/GlpR family DNA-binding transcription regulator [Muriicola sp.]NNC61661.1 DeoR/GlpR transcriptional regulator [Eudoraea sp.]NNK20213.1 DeoR/GlpR transcriptional regulator [Flavobacteriaceae bacterium]MBT8290166.1 DeoR/GlpR family DNA-binding transcription regulator [Muriicola sp.]NNK35360.1 DeoR/GlpR transcriptional regulator [Eudoraea sp.]